MTFYTPKNLSPKQKDLLKYLGGQPYRKNIIDGENVVYRDLGVYDIEISGGHRKTQPFNIYVWLKSYPRIVERHLRLPHDHAMIKGILDDIVERYSNKKAEG
jgi:hypothetical protein